VIDQQVKGIAESFRQLIPSCSVGCGYTLARQIESEIGDAFRANRDCGLVFHRDGAFAWIAVPKRYAYFKITREMIPLSGAEQEFLNYFTATARGLVVESDIRNIKTTGMIASRYSFEHVLVSRYLHRQRSGTLWTAALVLSELQQLSFQKYEGQACTSGFVFLSEPERQIAALEPEYRFQPFEKFAKLDESFFHTPAAYRYVDGRNAFYAIDHVQQVYGVARLKDPTRYGRIARSAYDHVDPLLRGLEGRAWVVCSSRPHELEVIARSGRHLRWNKSHWHFVDRSIAFKFLEARGIASSIATALVQVTFALSEMHVGTVLLIPDDAESLPRVAGQIDSSNLAQALIATYSGRLLPELVADNSIIGLLGSDGLTILGKNGAIRSSGLIIDLQAEQPNKAAGGGRTQAALAASRHGTVIKVSQDGPVSIFYGGTEVVKYNI